MWWEEPHCRCRPGGLTGSAVPLYTRQVYDGERESHWQTELEVDENNFFPLFCSDEIFSFTKLVLILISGHHFPLNTRTTSSRGQRIRRHSSWYAGQLRRCHGASKSLACGALRFYYWFKTRDKMRYPWQRRTQGTGMREREKREWCHLR